MKEIDDKKLEIPEVGPEVTKPQPVVKEIDDKTLEIPEVGRKITKPQRP